MPSIVPIRWMGTAAANLAETIDITAPESTMAMTFLVLFTVTSTRGTSGRPMRSGTRSAAGPRKWYMSTFFNASRKSRCHLRTTRP